MYIYALVIFLIHFTYLGFKIFSIYPEGRNQAEWAMLKFMIYLPIYGTALGWW